MHHPVLPEVQPVHQLPEVQPAGNESDLLRHLEAVDDRQDAVAAGSGALLLFSRFKPRGIAIWRQQIYQAAQAHQTQRLLGLCYVANDVLLYAADNWPEYFFDCILSALEIAVTSCQLSGQSHVLQRMARLPGIWRDRQVFRPEMCDDLAGLFGTDMQKNQAAVSQQACSHDAPRPHDPAAQHASAAVTVSRTPTPPLQPVPIPPASPTSMESDRECSAVGSWGGMEGKGWQSERGRENVEKRTEDTRDICGAAREDWELDAKRATRAEESECEVRDELPYDNAVHKEQHRQQGDRTDRNDRRAGQREAESNWPDERACPGERLRCGVGMNLAPKDPGRDKHLRVKLIKPGGPLAAVRDVKVGDLLVRVDGRDCRGVLRDVVKEWVLGEPGTSVQLVFVSGVCSRRISVTLRRSFDVVANRGQTQHETGDTGHGEERRNASVREGRREERREEAMDKKREQSERMERCKDNRYRVSEDGGDRQRELGRRGRGGSEHEFWKE
eukprot:1751068-Rhodomonas_salina.1